MHRNIKKGLTSMKTRMALKFLSLSLLLTLAVGVPHTSHAGFFSCMSSYFTKRDLMNRFHSKYYDSISLSLNTKSQDMQAILTHLDLKKVYYQFGIVTGSTGSEVQDFAQNKRFLDQIETLFVSASKDDTFSLADRLFAPLANAKNLKHLYLDGRVLYFFDTNRQIKYNRPPVSPSVISNLNLTSLNLLSIELPGDAAEGFSNGLSGLKQLKKLYI